MPNETIKLHQQFTLNIKISSHVDAAQYGHNFIARVKKREKETVWSVPQYRTPKNRKTAIFKRKAKFNRFTFELNTVER